MLVDIPDEWCKPYGDLGGNSYWCPPCSGAMILTPP